MFYISNSWKLTTYLTVRQTYHIAHRQVAISSWAPANNMELSRVTADHLNQRQTLGVNADVFSKEIMGYRLFGSLLFMNHGIYFWKKGVSSDIDLLHFPVIDHINIFSLYWHFINL